MSLSFKIARRYFFSRKSGGAFNLISVISGISLLGYMAGAAALIIVLSVFNGFENIFVSLYNNFDSDIQVSAIRGKSFSEGLVDFNKLNQIQGISTYSRVLEENVLLRYHDRQSIATAKGVDDAFLQMTSLDSCMVSGEKIIKGNNQSYALVGQGIAYQLAVDPTDIFNRLIFYVPKQSSTFSAADATESFNQDAIYPSGSFTVQQEVDDKYVLVPLDFIRTLIDKPGQISSLEFKLKADADPDDVKEELQYLFPESEFIIKNRFEQREAFFKVMKSEKLMSYFILFFILLIAASNTVGSLYILVIEKKKDIQILSGMGIPAVKAGRIFIYEGILQALTGGGIGLIIGLFLCYMQEQYGFIKLNEAAVFILQAYPVKIKVWDIVLVISTLILLGILTSLYPAYKARKLTA